jgi:HSP20 family protein
MPSAVTRWDPFSELGDLRARFNRMFEDMGEGREGAWLPAVDIVRDDDNLVIKADIPGITPDDVTIEVEGDMLRVSGSHEEESEDKRDDYLRRERRYGAFYRSFQLPPGVDPNAIAAKTRDGVLEVTVPLPSTAKKEPIQITPTAG